MEDIKYGRTTNVDDLLKEYANISNVSMLCPNAGAPLFIKKKVFIRVAIAIHFPRISKQFSSKQHVPSVHDPDQVP